VGGEDEEGLGLCLRWRGVGCHCGSDGACYIGFVCIGEGEIGVECEVKNFVI